VLIVSNNPEDESFHKESLDKLNRKHAMSRSVSDALQKLSKVSIANDPKVAEVVGTAPVAAKRSKIQVECELCGGKFAGGAGLSSHRRSKHPELFTKK
jgi:hypothetical protein